MAPLRVRGRSFRALPVTSACLSALGFLAVRLALEHTLRRHGHPGGLLEYDSYYEFSFARELEREGHWLLFRNPFGSLDTVAGLFNGPATALRALRPLWDGHVLAFDIVLGVVTAAVGGWFFGAILEQLAPVARAGVPIVLALALTGGGLGFVGHAAHLYSDRSAGLLGSAYWGPTWPTNDIATWELAYHAVFWSALATFMRRRVVVPLVLAGALALLHPFSIASLAVTCIAVWLPWRHRDRASAPHGVTTAAIAAIAVATTVVYQWLLPAHSADARFFLDAYRAANFHLPAGASLAFFAPVAALIVVRMADRARDDDPPPVHPATPGLALAAIALVAISLSAPVTNVIPQPAHWIRVYPLALLALAAGALPAARRRSAGTAAAATVAAAALIAIAVADSVLAVRAIGRDLAHAGPPVLLTADEDALIGRLRTLPAKPLVYIRPCDRPSPSADLEYAISALTKDSVRIGHAYFTPALAERSPRFLACNQTPASLGDLAGAERYVVRSPGGPPRLAGATRVAGLGRFELMTAGTSTR